MVGRIFFGLLIYISVFIIPRPVFALEIDVNTNLGTNSGKGIGFHGGFNDSTPDAMLDPLKPQLIRRLGGSRVWDRASRYGTTVIMLLAGYDHQGNWPNWVSHVTNQVNTMKSHNVLYHYDVWNEPDLSQFWSGSRQDFFVWYRDTYRLLKQLDPNAKVSGPSIASYNAGYISEFLNYAKANAVVPDILSWHEMGNHSPSGLNTNINHAKSLASQLGITIGAYEINEEINQSGATIPAVALTHIASVVRNNIFGSARAYWTGLDSSAVAQMNHLLTSNYQPRSVWWVYAKYAALNGTLLNVTYDAFTDAVAVKNTTDRKISGLIGKYATGTSSTNLKNVSAAGINTPQAIVKIWRIPDSGINALTAPIVEGTTTVAVSSDSITLNTPSFNTNQVFYFEITPSGSAVIPGDANGDNRVDGLDYIVWLLHYGQNVSGVTNGDFNTNGTVDGLDYVIWLNNYGRS